MDLQSPSKDAGAGIEAAYGIGYEPNLMLNLPA